MRPTPRRAPSGVTLIELMVLVILLACAVHGASRGWQAGSRRGAWTAIGGAAGGFVLGGLTGMAGIFAILLPFSVGAMAYRALQPRRLTCRCGKGSSEPSGDRFVAELPCASRGLSARDAHGAGEARFAIAASLGHPACEGRSAGPLPAPVLDFKSWAVLPPELDAALRAGLPPRLVLTWASGCAARALDVFEAEFHEEPRARAIRDACRAALDRPDAEAAWPLEELESLGVWDYAGCRVVDRPFWPRVLARRTRGEFAADAIRHLRGAAGAYCLPKGLWETHAERTMSDAYDDPELRLSSAQPAAHAAAIADAAARAAEDPKRESAWQRTFLAHLVLAWDTWDRDLSDWRRRVEDEWVPRVKAELTRARFDIAAYVDRIPRELAPRTTPAAGPPGARSA